MKAINLAIAAAAVFILPAAASFAATADQCSAMFKQADTNGDGSLGRQEEAAKFDDAMTKASVEIKDSKIISMEEFMMSCEKGTFDGM